VAGPGFTVPVIPSPRAYRPPGGPFLET